MSFIKNNKRLLFVVIITISVLFKWLNKDRINSVVMLALKYQARPHTNIASDEIFHEINSSAAWQGAHMKYHSEVWSEYISGEDKEMLIRAVIRFQSLNKPVETMSKLDFEFSDSFVQKIAKWKNQLGPQGRGFQLIRGIPGTTSMTMFITLLLIYLISIILTFEKFCGLLYNPLCVVIVYFIS